MSDFIGPITNMVSRVWDCSSRHTNYLRELEENLDNLRTSLDELKDRKHDVKNRVDAAEAQLMTRTHSVNGWLQRVEDMEREVDQILQKGSQQLESRCLSGCCPKNCWSSYKLGKTVRNKLPVVIDLKNKGDFQDVADGPLPTTVQVMPENQTVGLDSKFEVAWNLLGVDDVRILGLYGMGGVGKTTLLKKINNEYEKRTRVFDLVIWVVVSKDVNLERVQSVIGEKLGFSWPESRDLNSRASDVFNALRNKKFVLLLDDIWERLDLSSIGIPFIDSNACNKSKIVFTTRSETVCGRMEADKKIRVECLSWDQAWDLFKKKVGEEALSSHPEISKVAEIVAKECGGLPLALITLGRTMASKKTLQEWHYAVTILRKSAAEYSGMGDEILPILKFSYDSLPDDGIRPCFLFCSLYPEDYEIEEERLIEQWIGLGYIDEFDSTEEGFSRGHHIIGSLKAACLLESGGGNLDVKMHDVIRDLALWIGCECGRKNDKLMVKAGKGFNEAPRTEKWTRAEIISLFGTKITKLDDIPNCPSLSTLLLNYNRSLNHIHDDFFLFMPALRFLDLSWSGISELPTSIGKLVQLEYLDLSWTKIRVLPCEILNLTRLKCLFLYVTPDLIEIPHGFIKQLSHLQMLKISDGNFGYREEELESLFRLNTLDITVSNEGFLEWFLNNQKLVICTRSLAIECCKVLGSMTVSPSMKRLRKLYIGNCLGMKELRIDLSWAQDGGETGFFPFLENMTLFDLPNLINISGGTSSMHHRLYLTNLRHLAIYKCDALVELRWLVLFPNMESLHISYCDRLEEIIASSDYSDANTFSNLKTLSLHGLPKPRFICKKSSHLLFPCLNWIKVINCPNLRTLPLHSNSCAHETLQYIEGSSEWWNNLEWDDEAVKSKFTPFFKTTIYF